MFAEFNELCFQNAPSKHPIIILKDTLREEAEAKHLFTYTGEVRHYHHYHHYHHHSDLIGPRDVT